VKRYIILCMLVCGSNNLAAMTRDAHVRTRNIEEMNAGVAQRIKETERLIKMYQGMSAQTRAQLSDSFLKSIESNIQALEKEWQALDASQEAIKKDLKNEISRLRTALDNRTSQDDGSEKRSLNPDGGQAGNPKKPRKSCCDKIWDCFGRRDVQCATSLGVGYLLGKKKWKKS
jgi:hypothetical protein